MYVYGLNLTAEIIKKKPLLSNLSNRCSQSMQQIAGSKTSRTETANCKQNQFEIDSAIIPKVREIDSISVSMHFVLWY